MSITLRSKEKIIDDLKVLSSLTPGKTLSTTTMTTIDHSSWATSFSRRWAGEDRNSTIEYIKGILHEAILFCETQSCDDMYAYLALALDGVLNLKETYKGDYYTIANIDRIVTEVRNKLSTLQELDTCIDEILDGLELDDEELQKKYNVSNDQTDISEMVEASDRELNTETSPEPINIVSTIDDTKDNSSLCSVSTILEEENTSEEFKNFFQRLDIDLEISSSESSESTESNWSYNTSDIHEDNSEYNLDIDLIENSDETSESLEDESLKSEDTSHDEEENGDETSEEDLDDFSEVDDISKTSEDDSDDYSPRDIISNKDEEDEFVVLQEEIKKDDLRHHQPAVSSNRNLPTLTAIRLVRWNNSGYMYPYSVNRSFLRLAHSFKEFQRSAAAY